MPAPVTSRETLLTWYIEEHSSLNTAFTEGVKESTRHEAVMNKIQESDEAFEQTISHFNRLDSAGFITADGDWSAKGKRYTGWCAKQGNK